MKKLICIFILILQIFLIGCTRTEQEYIPFSTALEELETYKDYLKKTTATDFMIDVNSDAYNAVCEVGEKCGMEVVEVVVALERRDYFNTNEVTSPKFSNSPFDGINLNKCTDEEACYMAQDIVEKELKSPSNARFCPYNEMTVTDNGNGNYLVTGWVDAQNSFGATLRSSFIATFDATSNGYENAGVIFLEN